MVANVKQCGVPCTVAAACLKARDKTKATSAFMRVRPQVAALSYKWINLSRLVKLKHVNFNFTYTSMPVMSKSHIRMRRQERAATHHVRDADWATTHDDWVPEYIKNLHHCYHLSLHQRTHCWASHPCSPTHHAFQEHTQSVAVFVWPVHRDAQNNASYALLVTRDTTSAILLLDFIKYLGVHTVRTKFQGFHGPMQAAFLRFCQCYFW